MITFEYNGRIYKPSNLDKKLKVLGITKDDIIIIEDKPSNNEIISNLRAHTIKQKHKYCFWNNKCKGWFDTEYKDLQNYPFDKTELTYIGETLDNESISDAHIRLFKKI